MTFIKRSAIATALAVYLAIGGMSVTPPASATGFPVIDIAALQQSIARYVTLGQQLTQLEKQLDTAKQELSTANQQYSSMTGSRGLGSIDSENYNANMPTTWQQTLSQEQGGSVGQIASQIKQSVSELSQPQFAYVDTTVKQDLDTNMTQASNSAAQNAQSYKDSTARFQRLNDLMGQINQTTDQKGISELQARIQIEQANIANELVRLQSMNAMAQQQQVMQQQKQQQDDYKMYSVSY